MAARRRSEGGGFFAVLGTLFVIGLIIKYIWWIVGAAAAVGLFFAVRALLRWDQERRDLAAYEQDVLRARAERQNRWLLAGDTRGVYGPEGAAAMEVVSPTPDLGDDEPRPCATLARTPAELTALIETQPTGWEQAVFASVMVQRTTAVLDRLRDSELGYISPTGRPAFSGADLAATLTSLVDGMVSTMRQVEGFVMAPAFMAAFGSPGGSGDADALVHHAHRLMDYRDRFLELSEDCRALSVPSRWGDAQADCARLLDGPLQSFREFIDEFVEVVDMIPGVVEHSSEGVVHLGSLGLFMKVDDRVRSRLFRRLDRIAKQ
jgi:hypothetical protein